MIFILTVISVELALISWQLYSIGNMVSIGVKNTEPIILVNNTKVE